MDSYEASLPLPTGGAPFSYPIAKPDPSSVPAPPRPPHSPDQVKKLADIIAHFNRDDFKLPATLAELKVLGRVQLAKDGEPPTKGLTSYFRSNTPTNEVEPPLIALNDVEKCYWSAEAFLRCLRATKWDYDAAVKRAESTLVWRREFGTEDLGAEKCSKEAETGKEIVVGYDINLRPVLYMHPYRQNTETSPSQIDFVVFCLERAIDLCPPTDPATDTICLCIDFGSNRSDAKAQPTPLYQAKKVLDILQTYYCERLGRAICVNVPSLFWAFYKLVGPFVDPVTKDKIRFLTKPDVTDLVPPSQLQSMFGGLVNFEYDHNTYFPAIIKLCNERKAANLARWRQYGGGKCGLSESVIRGATVPATATPGTTVVDTSPSTTVDAEEKTLVPEQVSEDRKAIDGVTESVQRLVLEAQT